MLGMLKRLIAAWLAEVERVRAREKNTFYANGLEAAAEDLESCLSQVVDLTGTIAECAEVCGFSIPTLRRLMDDRQIENAGVPGAPRLHFVDLPYKPNRLRALLSGSDAVAPVPPPHPGGPARTRWTNARASRPIIPTKRPLRGPQDA